MNIAAKNIWQIAAGNGFNTHYANLCLTQQVIILGPGRYGPWPNCEMPMRTSVDPLWSATKVGINRRFAEDLKQGDIIVLRVGTRHVYGVGELVGNYGFSELFSDVQGWDLQHYWRVRWLWHQDGEPMTFPTHTLKFGSSVQFLTSPVVRLWLEALDIPDEAYKSPIKPL